MKSDIYCRARLHSNAAAAGEGRHAKNKGNSSANAIFPMFVSVVARRAHHYQLSSLDGGRRIHTRLTVRRQMP